MTREDILRSLRDEFRENTRSRLIDMGVLLGRLEQSPDDSRLTELERHFHGLAGLGGTYGYHSVTNLCREGEDICGTGSPTPGSADYARLKTILRLVAEAIEEVPDSE